MTGRLRSVLISGDDMRLGSVTASMALSAVLLSGCSFITGQPGSYKNPFAKQKAANQGQYQQGRYGQFQYGQAPQGATRCQVFSPQQPIPRGCRPEQVTLAVAPQGGQFGAPAQLRSTNGFPQQPQFADASFGAAVGQAQGQSQLYQDGPRIKKPRLRGSLSLGVEKSLSGELLDVATQSGLQPTLGFNPQLFNETFNAGSESEGETEQNIFTANEQFADDIFNPSEFESESRPSISFDDVWSTPATIKGGLEYIAGRTTTVFANAGYTHAEGNQGDAATVNATLYRQTITQSFVPQEDAAGDPIPGVFVQDGAPTELQEFIPNVQIASFSYDFSDLRRYDLEVGARHYFNPIVKSEGFRTITPFVGASVGAAHVNAVDVTFAQRQLQYADSFENLTNSGEPVFFDVIEGNRGASSLVGTTQRLYDAQWVPQGQLNVGAEWQVTPGFALAAESGVRIQGAREYADFTNAAGDVVSGAKGDTNISIPFTLRGSVNF